MRGTRVPRLARDDGVTYTSSSGLKLSLFLGVLPASSSEVLARALPHRSSPSCCGREVPFAVAVSVCSRLPFSATLQGQLSATFREVDARAPGQKEDIFDPSQREDDSSDSDSGANPSTVALTWLREELSIPSSTVMTESQTRLRKRPIIYGTRTGRRPCARYPRPAGY